MITHTSPHAGVRFRFTTLFSCQCKISTVAVDMLISEHTWSKPTHKWCDFKALFITRPLCHTTTTPKQTLTALYTHLNSMHTIILPVPTISVRSPFVLNDSRSSVCVFMCVWVKLRVSSAPLQSEHSSQAATDTHTHFCRKTFKINVVSNVVSLKVFMFSNGM